jgi:heat shock protein HtpX
MENLFRTGLLIAALTALLMAVDYRVAGPQGVIVALINRRGDEPVQYWNADRIVLSI